MDTFVGRYGTRRASGTPTGIEHAPPVVDLDDPQAADAKLTGAKAANLARARRVEHPVLPGLVITTPAAASIARHGTVPLELTAVLQRELADRGWTDRSLVARSSSTVEDAGESSMAGQFDSVLDLRGWDALADGIVAVVRSAERADLDGAPIAVLVQPFLPAVRSGVLFGADPVRHDADHLVVASTDEGPDALVSGAVDGDTTVLTLRGRHAGGAELDRRTRRRLAQLARHLAHDFGGPQDVEWAIDADDRLHLLQTRPITTPVHHGEGPRLGPGPVAETFPVPLTPLELDLWVEPLRAGLAEAVQVSGTVSAGALKRSPVVLTVEGNVAVDLDLLDPKPIRGLRRLDPLPPVRRLLAAWRVGRLRASLPALATDLVREVDTDLAEVPPLDELSDRQVLGMFRRTSEALAALHGYEVLAGLLLDVESAEVTGASLGLRALAEGRRLGEDDAEIRAARPVVLALLPPTVGPPVALPATPPEPTERPEPVPCDQVAVTTVSGAAGAGSAATPATPCDQVDAATDVRRAALAREALRVRVRWVQELQARAAWHLAHRLVARGQLEQGEDVRWLRLGELAQMVEGAGAPSELAARAVTAAAPLPASFHLSADGDVVTDLTADGEGQGAGAGGGTGSGPVHVGIDTEPQDGDVLVVRTLDPGLAPLLSRLGGLVAETGSPLSHLAILAREHHVPTVVGRVGATVDLTEGEVVVVDGETGEVRTTGDDAPAGPQRSEATEAA
jgi:pyruvate,water dikinase